MAEVKEAMQEYDIIKQIGTGSFGIVYLVKPRQVFDEHVTNSKGELLVLKLISLTKLDTKQRIDAQKEITLLSTLTHPNIVSYRHSFQNETQQLHIIMDYCDGGDLYRKISERRKSNTGPFDERQLINWFVQVCLALRHIHERKILHRDLKTQNIFTCAGDHVVKLGDFGIARILDHTADLAATCIGTPYYLSPEVCQNRPYGTKTDVWALGCVFYELATFRHPFEGRHLTELLSKIVRGTYEQLPPIFSPRFKNLISQMLKVNSSDRPDVNGLLQREYVYEHVTTFLKKVDRLDELSIVEDLMKRKRKLTQGSLCLSARHLGVNANTIHRQSTDFGLFRKKSSLGAIQRSHFEKKYRMYMPSPPVTKNRPKEVGTASHSRPATVAESHVPMDPVPPPVALSMPSLKQTEQVETVQLSLDTNSQNPNFGATVILQKPTVAFCSTRPCAGSVIGTRSKPRRRERKKWAAFRPPVVKVMKSPDSSDSSTSAASATATKELVLVPETKLAIPRRAAASSLPSLPGSVDDGWPDQEPQRCHSCGCVYVAGNSMRGEASVTKQCRACTRAKRQGSKSEINNGSSIFEQIECLRQELEESLGFQRFVKIYSNVTSRTAKLSNTSIDRLDADIKRKLQNLVFLEKAYMS